MRRLGLAKAGPEPPRTLVNPYNVSLLQNWIEVFGSPPSLMWLLPLVREHDGVTYIIRKEFADDPQAHDPLYVHAIEAQRNLDGSDSDASENAIFADLSVQPVKAKKKKKRRHSSRSRSSIV